MTDAADDVLNARADLYLCLSRAFLPPQGDTALAALRDALPQDLAELAAALGLDFAGELAAYRDALARLAGPLELLQIYSRLFLSPPRHTQINTGSYLDGAIGGGCVLALEHEYSRHGVVRADDFYDLADHVAVQLEFVACLFLRAAGGAQAGDAAAAEQESHARRFLYDYPRRWLPPFIDDLAGDLARYELPANPWLHLARMLAVAVTADARAPEIPASELRRTRAIDKARRARAARGVTAEDMDFIARRLRDRGLSTEHLAIAPEARDAAMGLEKKTPPTPRHTRTE